MNSFRTGCLLMVLLGWSFVLNGQSDSDFCASTDPNTGVITLNWHYDQYSLYTTYDIKWGTTPVPSSSVTIPVTGADMSYTVPGTNGLTTRYYFHVTGTGPPSIDIVFSNILLDISPSTYDIANLSWNHVYFPDTGEYIVERFDNAAWKQIAVQASTGPSPSMFYYNDTISYPYCDTSLVTYRISFHKPGNQCTSQSNEAEDEYLDRFPPSNPSDDTVSIFFDPTGTYTGSPIIGWTASNERDVAYYVIYREDPVFIAIDTIPADSTIFLDKSVNACLKSYTYALAAIDSCGKTSYGTYTLAPSSLVLNVSDIDPCERKVNLSWNAYNNMPGGLGGYYVYRQVNNGPFAEIATVNDNTTSYTDSLQFINGYFYTYYIRAFSANGTGSSSSCMSRKTYNGPVVPDTLYIEQVNVVNDSYVEVSYYYSPTNRIRQLLLERSNDKSGTFMPVDTLVAPGNSFLPTRFYLSDPYAQVDQQSYWYRITMIDSCNKAALFSPNISCSILLTCTNPGTNNNLLRWNAYSDWSMGVDRYELHRLIDGNPDPATPLAVLTNPPFEYVDDLNTLSPIAQACYYVKAFELSGNPVKPDAESTSNITCSVREPLVYMPTAFNPDGQNNRFRPVHSFVETGSFSMQIYNKWGQLIFETSDIYGGWNGYVNGYRAPSDVYLYRISYRSYQGDTFEKRGLVTLVK